MTVLVTGEHSRLPALSRGGAPVQFVSVPVLQFQPESLAPEKIQSVLSSPPPWIVFTSPRGVEFWEQGVGSFPSQSRLAAVGEATAQRLPRVDFVPSAGGSEVFLKEFLGREKVSGARVLIPGPVAGRELIAEGLTAAGAQVERWALYRTLPREGLQVPWSGAAAIVFTSPSSVDAVLRAGPVPSGLRVLSMGSFTSERLRAQGLEPVGELAGGDWSRLGEYL